jgi:hypothetical protein
MLLLTAAAVSIRQHTSAYASIRQHTSAYVSICQHTSAYVSIRQHTPAYVSVCDLEHLLLPHAPLAAAAALRLLTLLVQKYKN